MFKVDTKFELAFRRALFIGIILTVYLSVGSVIIRLFASINGEKIRPKRLEKLDFERSELLNVLWAESLGRSEHDWSQLANQKLDSYEKSLQNIPYEIWESADGSKPSKALDTFGEAFQFSFLLITTIGPIDVDTFGNEPMKIFAIFYALCGMPLVLIYLSQCSKAITAILNNSEQLFLAGVVAVLAIALVWDVAEGNNGDDGDTPFVNAIFGTFLTLATIGVCGQQQSPPSWLLYAGTILGLALIQSLIQNMQRAIERRIGRYELAFSAKVGQVERVLSMDRMDEIPDYPEEEEDDDYSSGSRKVSVHFALDPIYEKSEKDSRKSSIEYPPPSTDSTAEQQQATKAEEELLEDIQEEDEDKSEYQSLHQ